LHASANLSETRRVYTFDIDHSFPIRFIVGRFNLIREWSSTCPGGWLAWLELPGIWPVIRIAGPDVLEIDCIDYLLPAIGKFKNWK
jgi:hypothetical protein